MQSNNKLGSSSIADIPNPHMAGTSAAGSQLGANQSVGGGQLGIPHPGGDSRILSAETLNDRN